MPDVSGVITRLTETVSAACTNACTRIQEAGHGDPLEVLADELRNSLAPDDLERFTGLLAKLEKANGAFLAEDVGDGRPIALDPDGQGG